MQVFSNKPVASDRNAVFVIQVDMFAGLVWIWIVLFFCLAIEGLTVHAVFSHELVTANL